ncbi:MAG TPA: S-layer homology domain-containing protein [Methylomusa anaerophila]|uniref:SLH domain-containing protein n=1 Tax=Methylomusa anaerophila TaxID=1930071 RepID=A0A348AJ53_9FIRM|nr:S-layer homology domain-containing protein [Methylomusa anaerophila]BBB91101.1 hypothetical protein MAMMFC1_01770 [Methylomusa anaerophila]HML88978.1 S-layer homology domain-containing protein [Methylomusa anaerophila]
MKKGIILIFVLILTSFSALASAASNLYSDVPENHWAYDALGKLAKAGIISNFREERVLTRYEMAQIIANALTKVDKANAETQALVQKLSAEFADELNDIGVRGKKTEEKEDTRMKISGFGIFGYEWVKNPRTYFATNNIADGTSKSETRSIFVLTIDQKFSKDAYFHADFNGEVMGGRSGDNSVMRFQDAYYAAKAGGLEWSAGRYSPYLGKGLLYYVPYNDGVRLTFGNVVKTTLYSVKFNDRSWELADIGCQLSKNTNLSLAYVNDKVPHNVAIYPDQDFYNSAALGISYTGITNWTVTGEYGKNRAEEAKKANGGSSPYGMYIMAKYKGANPFVIGSTGAWVTYKQAQDGFDLWALTSRTDLTGPQNWSAPGCGGGLNDVRGFEVGFEATVAPRAMLSMRYDSLRAVKTPGGLANAIGADQKDQSYFISQLTWVF